jgi:hypothetical protein
MAGRHYQELEGGNEAQESVLIEKAVTALGLNQLAPFDPQQRIIEYMIG